MQSRQNMLKSTVQIGRAGQVHTTRCIKPVSWQRQLFTCAQQAASQHGLTAEMCEFHGDSRPPL